MISATLSALMLAASAPSFDCAKAEGVERTVCAEPRLAALDARLAELYGLALKVAPGEAPAVREAQRAWLHKRNEVCARAAAPARCLDGYYRNRVDELDGQQRRRDESAGHASASGTYAGFVGRWRVVGVTAADDAGEVANFGSDDPRYMGLELSAGPGEAHWLNGTKDNSTTDVCTAPSFVRRSVSTPLPSGWKAVTLACKGGQYWTEWPVAITLKAQDLAELEWEDGALLHLKRVDLGDRTPPPPHSAPPPLPPGDDLTVTPEDKAFFLALQAAVRRRDRKWLAGLGGVQVNRPDGASHDYKPNEVLEAYDWIITPEVERAVLTQSPDELSKNVHGVVVGGGEVWFSQVWNRKRWVFVITAVNDVSSARRTH